MRSNKIKLHMHPNSATNSSVQPAHETVGNPWRMGALMGAVTLLCSLASMDASALALGRITVQSTLGEPLRAEIEIAEINAAEAASLQTKVASPEAFKAAGIEFTPVLSGLAISLQKRADGRSYLRLVGNRTVSEPFVDLIVEANWSAGRVSRDYTMLFDPPVSRNNSASAQGAQILPMVPRPVMPSPASTAAKAPYTPSESPAVRAPVLPANKSTPVAVARAATSRAPGEGSEVTVRPGDTAGKIAAQTKASNVSLDQMLLALLRQNPEAFVGGNVNRVRSGAVLQIPGQDVVAAIAPGEATQTIVAQSADFNAFRRKLAGGVPATTLASADRQATGKMQAKVEDRAPVSAVPDKLTLSKGAIAGKSAASAEQQIATARQANDSASRVAELSKNISELNKLGAASSTTASGPRPVASGITVPLAAPTAVMVASAAASTPIVAKPAVPASSAASAVVPTPAATSSAAAPASAVTSVATAAMQPASAPASAAATASALALSPASAPSEKVSAASDVTVKPASASVAPAAIVKPAPAVAERGLVDELVDNTFVLPGLALLVALIGGLAFYRNRQGKRSMQVDSSFLESRLQPDSFFGASGGQRVDTSDGSAAGTSLVYSPSQLDAAGDVDPVAEADVYLAYGRDLQAEEILKEALRTSPTRVAIHAKLLEIYAKRHDVKAFGVVATEAFKLTGGEGSEWHYITEMGRELDPGNTMYQPGGQPSVKPAAGSEAAYGGGPASSSGFGPSTLPQAIEPQFRESTAAVDFDLDLDFSMDEPVAWPAVAETPAAPVVSAPHAYVTPVIAAPAPMFNEIDMDFGDSKSVAPSVTRPVTQKPEMDAGHSFDSAAIASNSGFKLSSATTAEKPVASRAGNEPLEFDMSDLSLDLDGPITEATPHSDDVAPEDPLDTKFSLAQEFSSLGDPEGARALVEEVLLEARGPLKTKAQAFLNALS